MGTIFRSVRAYSVTFIATAFCATTIMIIGIFDKPGRVLWPFARTWGWLVSKGIGVRHVEVVGRERLPASGGVILMANHESHLDPPLLIGLLPYPVRFLAKASLFRFPILGWAMWSMGMIPVNRDRRHKAFASIDRAAAMIRGGKTVLVFPEGRRTRTGELQPFKKGGFVMAVRGGVPIIPIGIAGSAHIFPPGFWIRAGGDTVVVIGEPVATSTYDMDSKEELMALVHEKMEALRTEAQARWVARRSP